MRERIMFMGGHGLTSASLALAIGMLQHETQRANAIDMNREPIRGDDHAMENMVRRLAEREPYKPVNLSGDPDFIVTAYDKQADAAAEAKRQRKAAKRLLCRS